MLKRIIKENVVDVEKFKGLKNCNGVIERVDYRKNRANVSIDNQFGQGKYLLKNVPFLNQDSCVKLSSFSRGDTVAISFDGGSGVGAKIIGSATLTKKRNHNLSNCSKETLNSNLTCELDIRGIIGTKRGTLVGVDIDKLILDTEKKLIGFESKDIGFSGERDSVIKTNGLGDVILSAGRGACVILRQDGTMEIDSTSIERR